MKPVMHAEELALFCSFLRQSEAYFEYGMGGSTCVAASLVKYRIDAVDTSIQWVSKVSNEIGNISGKSISLQHIDIGPTGEWGSPTSNANEEKFPGYSKAILQTGFADYDFCFVDGRFRVACFLQALSYLKANTVIGFHDYTSRPAYHLVEKYAQPICSVRELKMFVRRPNCDLHALDEDLARHRTVWA